jgi:UDP-glucose 4-epimerase
MYGDASLTADGTCIRDDIPMRDLADAHVLGLHMLAASVARPTIFGRAWAWQ